MLRLVNLVISRPPFSSGILYEALGVPPQAARRILLDLGVRVTLPPSFIQF
ncbi:hypothetical protein G6L91_32815 [Agrobacterium rhizogenes]|nr:hypothetical protein [Rhizobium rhizogenes]NTG97594.1 hypothetical protein [Rhizobium rhizogenes]